MNHNDNDVEVSGLNRRDFIKGCRGWFHAARDGDAARA